LKARIFDRILKNKNNQLAGEALRTAVLKTIVYPLKKKRGKIEIFPRFYPISYEKPITYIMKTVPF